MRFVIKIGTSLISNEQHQLDRDFLQYMVHEIADLRRAGHQVVIVSSGAVASGHSELQISRSRKNIPFRQALAAVGQGILMEAYRSYFKKYKLLVAQALLTNFDFTHRENFLNTKQVFNLLLEQGVIPVVNENDVTTMAELKFGDNDMLSAKTAAMVSADLLIILTDVDGFFDDNPRKNPKAKLVPLVEKIDDDIRNRAGAAASEKSSGGMITKIEAAAYVTSVGISMAIAYGKRRDVLCKIVEWFSKRDKTARRDVGTEKTGKSHFSVMQKSVFEFGTFFPAADAHIESQKKWLKPQLKKNAWIEIDEGAAAALQKKGKSLLPSGVVRVQGEFQRGDVVAVKSVLGGGRLIEIAYGQINYGSVDLDKIKKHRSNEIENILGFSFEEELMHRDRMVIA